MTRILPLCSAKSITALAVYRMSPFLCNVTLSLLNVNLYSHNSFSGCSSIGKFKLYVTVALHRPLSYFHQKIPVWGG